jgi:glycosyltransferase involved in cell wall biosynthesis
MPSILLLADINSSHTRKWAEELVANGYRIGIFSISKPLLNWYSPYGIEVLRTSESFDTGHSFFSKLKYVSLLSELKTACKKFDPDLMHAHYATSYGLLAALSGFKPYLISVWGSDVFDFPKRSFLHKQILKYNLKRSDCVISSSKIMAEEVRKYFSGQIEVIPFGIDLSVFKRNSHHNEKLTIGIIKSMEDYYGIDDLIRAFKIVIESRADSPLKLLLIGGGTQIEKYKKLVSDLGLISHVEFRGKIAQELVPAAHNEIDIFVNPSVHESFGVSVLEASATENPVIVTNVGGLNEVVVNNSTGFIVQQGNVNELVKAISYFVDNKEQIDIFGKKGRLFVSDNYDLKKVSTKITDLYSSFLKR